MQPRWCRCAFQMCAWYPFEHSSSQSQVPCVMGQCDVHLNLLPLKATATAAHCIRLPMRRCQLWLAVNLYMRCPWASHMSYVAQWGTQVAASGQGLCVLLCHTHDNARCKTALLAMPCSLPMHTMVSICAWKCILVAQSARRFAPRSFADCMLSAELSNNIKAVNADGPI